MKSITILLTTLFITAAPACRTTEPSGCGKSETISTASARTITEKSLLEDFSSLECSIGVEITYTPNKKASIELEIPESMADRIEYEVRNKRLSIRYKEKTGNASFKNSKVRCKITSRQLNALDLYGATEFTAAAPVESNHFTLDCSGAVKIRIPEIACKRFEAKLSGASQASLNIRKADYILIKNSGAGQLEIKSQSEETDICNSGTGKITADLNGNRVSLKNSGVGKFTVNVDCKKLYGSNSGVGKCSISGIADEVDLNNSGVSRFDVSRLNQ